MLTGIRQTCMKCEKWVNNSFTQFHFRTVTNSEQVTCNLPSVLWRCWLGGTKSIQPVKKLKWWRVGMVIWLQQSANDLHMVRLCHCHPIISASAKFRMVHPSGTGSRGQSRRKGRKTVVAVSYIWCLKYTWYLKTWKHGSKNKVVAAKNE